jgi:superfamily II DNA helicase RecQ
MSSSTTQAIITMMEHRPKILEQLSALHGVGKRKLELYGKYFLAVIGNKN